MIGESALLGELDRLGVSYRRFEHPAVFTCDEADRAVPDTVGGAHTKNLFLRDAKGRRHWLLVTSCAKAVDLSALSGMLDSGKLGFASPDRLARYLGVTPGAVTVLGLVNDAERAVELLVDREVWDAPAWRCHPLVNTATLVIDRAAVERFLEATGHRPRVVDVRARAPGSPGG
ncbi:MAG: prolyl-tRNA synthetase associated domain-containing protein [Gemmatimonadetes bacterium]|nr:prolyl-tRNA synthetase associated domain-containing protein [Gemmatimonadota bacterium]